MFWSDKDVLDYLSKNFKMPDNRISEDIVYHYFLDDWCEKADNFFKDFFWESGATKLVFVSKEDNYVYKIPFNGTGIHSEFEWFNQSDYCDIETRVCEELNDAGFGDLIAQEEFIGKVNGIPVYKQEKAECCNDYQYDHEEEFDRKEISNLLISNIENEQWLYDLKIYCGEKRALEFLNYLVNYGYDNDLHEGNYGYKNDIVALIDYSGYEEDY
jgi:hypothetical protein